MYGGWVIIPKDCTMKVTLSWYVPAANNNLYSLMFQPQASVFPQVSLSVSAPAGVCGSSSTNVHYSGTSDGADEMFSLAKAGSGCTLNRKE
jgi:hypothetical protein